jgi:hypothetical protein
VKLNGGLFFSNVEVLYRKKKSRCLMHGSRLRLVLLLRRGAVFFKEGEVVAVRHR